MSTFLITGVSSGLGKAIAQAALDQGHTVVGTLRKEEQRAEFEATTPGRSFGRLLDVTDTAAIQPLVGEVEGQFGSIDVLVNNAGYGLRGVLEELELGAFRQQIETGVVGPLALIQAVLPGMRARRSGHVVNLASMGSVITFPGLGAYHVAKFALLGLGDTLAKEVAGLGIKVTSVMPGVFSTDWSGRSQKHSEHKIHDYDEVLSREAPDMNGRPEALADVVLQAIAMEEAPEHLLVGPIAVKSVRERLAQWSAEIDRLAPLSESTVQG